METQKIGEICSKLALKTPEQMCEQISHIVLLFLIADYDQVNARWKIAPIIATDTNVYKFNVLSEIVVEFLFF